MNPFLHLRSILVILIMAVSSTAVARDLWTGDTGDSSLKFNTSLVGMGLVSAPPAHPLPGEGGTTGSLFGEMRFDAFFRINKEMQLDVAYDNRLTWSTGTSTGIDRYQRRPPVEFTGTLPDPATGGRYRANGEIRRL